MLTTPNLNLQKPEGTDSVSPSPFNNNADILDNALIRGAQTLTAGEQAQVQSNLDVLSSTDVIDAVADRAVRYDTAQTLSATQKAQALTNIGGQSGITVDLLLNTTSITTTAASQNCAWDDYKLLVFTPGISGTAQSSVVVPTSFFGSTTSSITVNMPCFAASTGAFAFTIQAYQNGSGKIYLKLASSTSSPVRLRVYGLIK